MSGFKGKQNLYTCQECGAAIVTEDLDEGVTPFMIRCRATDGCDGMMQSSCYRPMPKFRPHFIWRKPTLEEYAVSSSGMREHFDKGGLEIHPLHS